MSFACPVSAVGFMRAAAVAGLACAAVAMDFPHAAAGNEMLRPRPAAPSLAASHGHLRCRVATNVHVQCVCSESASACGCAGRCSLR